MEFQNVRAVIFDMDGTLIDSEIFTDRSVEALLRDNGISDPDLDCTQFYGTTFAHISRAVIARHPQLAGICTPQILHNTFQRLSIENPPPPIKSSPRAVADAKAVARTAIATASGRESVEHVIAYLNLGDLLDDYVCAEDYEHSKPNPECYLLAAERLKVDPSQCLVFEDSIPGLKAAKSAGMMTIAITCRAPDVEQATQIADAAIADYSELPADFFASITGTS